MCMGFFRNRCRLYSTVLPLPQNYYYLDGNLPTVSIWHKWPEGRANYLPSAQDPGSSSREKHFTLSKGTSELPTPGTLELPVFPTHTQLQSHYKNSYHPLLQAYFDI